MSKKSFVKGAAILATAGLIAKIIGALFRIPLMNIIDTEGMGIYQLAYPIYAFLLVISTAGIPTAISKLVSEKVTLGDQRGAYRIFRTSFKLLLVIGTVTSLVLFVGSPLFAKMQSNESSVYALMAIAPALFFVSLMSAYRGYFQGLQIMTPTALSQIIEQFGKLIMGLILASAWIGKGPEYGAAGALLGVTLSEVAALALLMGMFRRKKGEIFNQIRRSPKHTYIESERTLIYKILNIAIPVTIGASIIPIVNFADSIIVINRLKAIGYSKSQATSLYGMLTGGANPIISFPSIFTVALAMSLVPAISESYTGKDWNEIRLRSNVGIKLTLFIGMPAAVGMMVLSTPIISFLYRNMDGAKAAATGELLGILAIGVIFLTLIQTLTAILQGVDRVTVPVKNLAIGALCKIVLTIILVGIPEINVKGAAIGTVVCYGVAAILDFAAVIRYADINFDVGDFMLKPAIAAGIMGICVSLTYKYTFGLMKSNTKSTLLAIIVGIIVYILMVFATGMVKRQDLETVPKGNKIAKILDKMGLLRG